MTNALAHQPLITGPVQQYIEALLRHSLADEQDRQERIHEYEQAGHRIVNAGQTDGDKWEVTDWRTGQIIEHGSGGYEGYIGAMQRLDPDEKWILIDNIDEEDDAPEVDHMGLPASLANALQDWLGTTSTSDEDVAAVVGWSVEDVSRHRETD